MNANSKLVLVLSLGSDQLNERTLYRCRKYNTIQLIVGSQLFGSKIKVWTNYCTDNGLFDRNVYTQLDLTEDMCTLVLQTCGSFHFYYTSDALLGSFYVVVSPQLMVGHKSVETELALNAIQCQTVLTKCLGSFESWKQKLEVSMRTGYNMIHFTPVQELGASNSAYCLSDQLKLNPILNSSGKECRFEDLSELIETMRTEWKVLSITDIVLNHTANESPWLRTNPECAYNCVNSRWLRPAYLLDRLLSHFSNHIIDGRFESLTKQITTEQDLNSIRNLLHTQYLPQLCLDQFYTVDINDIIIQYDCALRQYCAKTLPKNCNQTYSKLEIIQDSNYRRLKSSIDFDNAVKMAVEEVHFNGNVEEWIEWSCGHIRHKLTIVNESVKKQMSDHLSSAVENVISAVRYERIDTNGPQIAELSKNNPLVPQYFKHEGPDLDLLLEEELMSSDDHSQYLMAHNGWVMNDDPLRNFAEEDSNVYIRRELIAWSDSIKLRYGSGPKDCVFLWTHMEKYVTQMASVFHGLRLDNCHSTPLNLAQHMIDCGRRVNPNLYLIAELFTSSEHLDNIFVNKLGINSLIREALSSRDAHDLGRQVYRYGAEPVGAFPPEILNIGESDIMIKPFCPSISHAIFFDLTHDNESPMVSRCAYDPLPSSALVAMTYSATGSNRGYDELVPHHIHVVNETRQYNIWHEINGVSAKTGIIESKREFNILHEYLCANGFNQAFVDQRDSDTIAVTRHNPITHESVVLIARTAFNKPNDPSHTGYMVPLRIDGRIEEIIFETRMVGHPDQHFSKNEKIINGYEKLGTYLAKKLELNGSKMIKAVKIDDSNEIMFTNFPPSSVIALKVSLSDSHQKAVQQINEMVWQFTDVNSKVNQIIRKLSLNDLNFVLFRCEREERDDISGGAYSLPSLGAFNYCGLSSIMYYLKQIRTDNDLGHPLCNNLRDGDWLTAFIVNRLSKRIQTKELSEWLSQAFSYSSQLPRYLIPRYFDAIFTPVYKLILDQIWSLSSHFVRTGSHFVKLLTFGSIALLGTNRTARLPPLSPKIINESVLLPTLAAGLPHFASGYMRNWGRDTFIALKGLLLMTGRFLEAKWIILGFAGTLRHGLIPNLLDGGVNARYNCRDSVWWWLQSIKDYCTLVPNGIQLISEPVRRLYPSDDSPTLISDDSIIEEPLFDTIQEALQKHFTGIDFIERNAGHAIDAHMSGEGFHITVGINRETGFVYGGNVNNCGTWMDKMGSSDKAGNRGKPSTPRDGSAVELIGLSKSVLSFVSQLYDEKHYPYEGVLDSDGSKYTFKQWDRMIASNFDHCFYISQDSTDPLINRRLIYKDIFGATNKWQDFQLRPNFLIAMTVAPELFDQNKSNKALDIVENTLIGPLGVRTLDPSDWNYRGDYDNSNDSNDYNIAHGFNYHNGPEWLWPMGFFIEAKLRFSTDVETTATQMETLLSKHYQYLESNDWFGLPELTNSEGKMCGHSCPIQAWSHSTILQALHSIQSSKSFQII